MATPNLLHPVPIIIQQISRQTALELADAREPIQHAGRAAPVTISGQVNWTSEIGGGVVQVGSRLGEEEMVTGYVLFRYLDLRNASITLQKEDRIRKIGNREIDGYIVRFQDVGHYPDASGATLVKAFFEARVPAKKRNA